MWVFCSCQDLRSNGAGTVRQPMHPTLSISQPLDLRWNGATEQKTRMETCSYKNFRCPVVLEVNSSIIIGSHGLKTHIQLRS